MVRWAIAGLVLVAGCGGDDDPAVDAANSACPGARPAITDCFVGRYAADCGGNREPRFACEPEGACAWFTGGCVAEGYVASDCPASDVCCHSEWPYDSPSSSWSQASHMIRAIGSRPWSAVTGAVLEVEIDPSVTAIETAIACDGPDFGFPGASTCAAAAHDGLVSYTQDTVIAHASPSPPAGLVGWYFFLEVLPGAPPNARVCAFQHSDEIYPNCNDYPDGPTCAVSGVVRLNRLPPIGDAATDVVAEIDVTFANGLHVTGWITHDASP